MKCLLAIPLLACLAVPSQGADAWRSFTTRKVPELAANEIQFMVAEGETLWIGTLSGLTRHRDGKFAVVSELVEEKQRHPETGEWQVKEVKQKADRQITALLKTGEGTHLVGTANGLYAMEDLTLRTPVFEGRTVAPVLRVDEDTLWALAKNGGGKDTCTVYAHSGEEWEVVEAFAEKAVVDAKRTPDGRIWVVIDGDGVFEVSPDQGADEVTHHLAGLNVRSLMLDSQGRLWCGLWGRGVAMRTQEGEWTDHLEYEESAMLRLAEDASGTVWVGTSSAGLFRYDGQTWTNEFPEEGAISLLYPDSQGRVWVSTQSRGGLRCWEEGTWRRSLDNRLPMTCMAEHEGALWAGGVVDGIHVLELE